MYIEWLLYTNRVLQTIPEQNPDKGTPKKVGVFFSATTSFLTCL